MVPPDSRAHPRRLAAAACVRQGHAVLDLFYGLGYVAGAAMALGATRVVACELLPDVAAIAQHNPISPRARLVFHTAPVVPDPLAVPPPAPPPFPFISPLRPDPGDPSAQASLGRGGEGVIEVNVGLDGVLAVGTSDHLPTAAFDAAILDPPPAEREITACASPALWAGLARVVRPGGIVAVHFLCAGKSGGGGALLSRVTAAAWVTLAAFGRAGGGGEWRLLASDEASVMRLQRVEAAQEE